MAEALKTPLAQLMPARMGLQEHKSHVWIADVEAGTTREQMANPAYWSLVALNFQPLDVVQVRSDDGGFWCELLVVECARHYAKMQELRFFDLHEQPQVVVPAELVKAGHSHNVAYRGLHKRWCVERITDGKVVADKLPSKLEAERWRQQHESTIDQA